MAGFACAAVDKWNAYWFRPAFLINLAILRIAAVGTQLLWFFFHDGLDRYHRLSQLPDDVFQPLPMLRLLLWPWGWGYRPPYEALEAVWLVAIFAATLALVGLSTNISLAVFAVCFTLLSSYGYSYGSLHHFEAVMAVALVALTLSPSGRMLSIDSWWQRRKDTKRTTTGPAAQSLMAKSPFAGWPILLIQWFFVLMYLSAFYEKMSRGGLDWMNGYTLQYILIRDGLKNGSSLGVWLGQFHVLLTLAQWVVVIFQSTFWVSLIFPRLKWAYVPLGFAFHVGIYLTMKVPFFQWMALYSVFIPWAAALTMLINRQTPHGAALNEA